MGEHWEIEGGLPVLSRSPCPDQVAWRETAVPGREGPPSAQSFAGHQTGAACLEGPRPAERIFNGTNLVLDSDDRGKTPSAVGLIPHPTETATERSRESGRRQA